MVGTLDPHGGIDLIHQAGSELRNKRNDGVEPLLEMLLGKRQAVQRSRIADRLVVPSHDLSRGLACNLSDLILNLAPAGPQRGGQCDIEAIQVAAESVESGRNRGFRLIE